VGTTDTCAEAPGGWVTTSPTSCSAIADGETIECSFPVLLGQARRTKLVIER
jgi:hypothetical protein